MGINWNRCKPSSPMSTHSSARTGLFQKFLIAEPTMRTISRPSITAWEQRHCFSKRTSKSFRSHPMEIGWNLKSEKGVAWWQHPSELHSCGALGGTRTPNLLIRSQMLYPIELRAQETKSYRTGTNPGKPVEAPGSQTGNASAPGSGAVGGWVAERVGFEPTEGEYPSPP